MKKILCGFSILMALTNVYAYTGYSVCNYGKQTVASVNCEGPAVLIDTTVMAGVTVVGPFRATNVSMGTLTITGDTDMDSCKVAGPATITGSLDAKKVSFKKGLEITSDNISLHHTTVKGNLTIHSANTNPTLTMECGSSVSGIVVFDGKAGIIRITDDSIVQGKITNGSMIFTKQSC